MITPAYLNPGDTVALISPARYMEMTALKNFQDWVEANGWKLKTAPNLGAAKAQLGGTTNQRLEDIQWALQEPSIKAVFCARGGYGTMQLVSELRKLDFGGMPKWWVGFSDICALHFTLNEKGLVSLHGPMAMQFESEEKCSIRSRAQLSASLKGESITIKIEDQESDQNPFWAHQTRAYGDRFTAPLWGGNLSMIYAMLASGSTPPKEPFILFLEDLDEYVYHIDRMMQALNLAGVLQQAVAVLVGSMCDMHDNAVPFGKNAKEIILDFCKYYNKPLIWGLPCGHESENIALKLGLDITFDGNYLIQN